MAYVKQKFVKGQVLTADQMNHIEGGIESNAVGIADLVADVSALIDYVYGDLISAVIAQLPVYNGEVEEV